MKHVGRIVLLIALLAAWMPSGLAAAQVIVPPMPGDLDSCAEFADLVALSAGLPPGSVPYYTKPPMVPGADYCIILPPNLGQVPVMNGLVIFAHGYDFDYPPGELVTIPWSQLVIDENPADPAYVTIPQLIIGQGFAFATTSYSKAGLAVKPGVDDVIALAEMAKAMVGAPDLPTFLAGASEGSLVATLAIERRPDLFGGAVAACGPIGDFQKQVNYWGDFRVVFDYYFPSNLLGDSAMVIPDDVMAGWGSISAPGPIAQHTAMLVQADLEGNNGLSTHRLLAATGAPVNPLDSQTIFSTVLGILEYNVFATMEAITTLEGVPYGNRGKTYITFPFDPGLNKGVERIKADRAALKNIDADYQTSGNLQRPVVILHNIGDPIVPYWHSDLYIKKAFENGSLSQLARIPVLSYGHCQFTAEHMLAAFQVMFLKASMPALSDQELQKVLPDPADQAEFQALKEAHQYEVLQP